MIKFIKMGIPILKMSNTYNLILPEIYIKTSLKNYYFIPII